MHSPYNLGPLLKVKSVYADFIPLMVFMWHLKKTTMYYLKHSISFYMHVNLLTEFVSLSLVNARNYKHLQDLYTSKTGSDSQHQKQAVDQQRSPLDVT